MIGNTGTNKIIQKLSHLKKIKFLAIWTSNFNLQIFKVKFSSGIYSACNQRWCSVDDILGVEPTQLK